MVPGNGGESQKSFIELARKFQPPPIVGERFGARGRYHRFWLETVSRVMKGGFQVVWGEPGSGKTTMVKNLIAEPVVRKALSGRGVWFDCEQSDAVQASLQEMLRAETVQQLLNTKALLVFDNFERIIPKSAEGVTTCLGAVMEFINQMADVSGDGDSHRLSCIVITREKYDPLPAAHRRIPPLEISDAERMFRHLAAACHPEFHSRGKREAIRRLCAQVGCLPLGIKLLSGLVPYLSLEQIQDDLKRGVEVLKAHPPPTEDTRKHWNIQACFKLSFDRLKQPAQELLMRLSIPPDGVSNAFVKPLTQVLRWGQSIQECVSLCLVDFDQKRYRFHPLTRQFAANILGRDEKVRWQRHFVDFFVQQVVDKKTNRARVPKEKEALLDVEWRNVLATMEVALDLGLPDRVAGMPEYFSDFLLKRGLLEERRLLNEKMIEAARELCDPVSEGKNMVLLGRVLIDLGRWKEAVRHFWNSIRLLRDFRKTAHENLFQMLNQEESESFLNISVAAARQRRWFTGLRAARMSMKLNQSETQRGECLVWIAHHLDNLGHFDEALDHHRESIRLIKKNRSSYIGICQMFYAWHLLLRNKLRAAEKILTKRVNECLKNQGMRATILLLLGEALRKLGKAADARRNFEEAAQIAEAVKDWSRRAEALFQLALLAQEQGDSRTAVQYKRRAQSILVRRRSEDVKLLDQVRGFDPR